MKYKYKITLDTARGLTDFIVEADNDYSISVEHDAATNTDWQVIGRNRFPLDKVIAVIYLS